MLHLSDDRSDRSSVLERPRNETIQQKLFASTHHVCNLFGGCLTCVMGNTLKESAVHLPFGDSEFFDDRWHRKRAVVDPSQQFSPFCSTWRLHGGGDGEEAG
ncbi:MAG TPA: hypothetical protein DCQ52_05050 [Acidimicrobiaceae bacterium]|nr:hypothetical protein [Acidimicrobiaceae bacterium]